MEPLTEYDVAVAQGDELTTKDNYAPELRAKAYETYLYSGESVEDIAIECGVERKVVMAWIRNGKWRQEKDRIERELMLRAEDGYRDVLLAERKKVLKRHLRVSEKLELGIEKLIDEALEAGQLNDRVAKRLSEALSSVTAISARAAAITDRAITEMLGDRDEKSSGKVPLIALGIQGDNVKVSVKENNP